MTGVGRRLSLNNFSIFFILPLCLLAGPIWSNRAFRKPKGVIPRPHMVTFFGAFIACKKFTINAWNNSSSLGLSREEISSPESPRDKGVIPPSRMVTLKAFVATSVNMSCLQQSIWGHTWGNWEEESITRVHIVWIRSDLSTHISDLLWKSQRHSLFLLICQNQPKLK